MRLIRGASLKSAHSPGHGYRYDGLYWVTDFWPEKEHGYVVYKFRLVRMAQQNTLHSRNVATAPIAKPVPVATTSKPVSKPPVKPEKKPVEKMKKPKIVKPPVVSTTSSTTNKDVPVAVAQPIVQPKSIPIDVDDDDMINDVEEAAPVEIPEHHDDIMNDDHARAITPPLHVDTIAADATIYDDADVNHMPSLPTLASQHKVSPIELDLEGFAWNEYPGAADDNDLSHGFLNFDEE